MFNDDRDEFNTNENNGSPLILKSTVKLAIKQLKINKVPGPPKYKGILKHINDNNID